MKDIYEGKAYLPKRVHWEEQINIEKTKIIIDTVELEKIDEESDLSLVYLKDGKPHCRVHGAMNCNFVSDTHKFYRCYSSYGVHPEDKGKPHSQKRYIDRTCEAACKVKRARDNDQ